MRDEALRDRGGYRAVDTDDPDESELLYRVTTDDEADRMPPVDSGRSLTEAESDVLARWIAGGAHYAEHWAFVKPERPAPPDVARAGWPRSELDRFVLARLEAEGLEPSPEADRWTLARRASLDLTGLPPTPEEARAFAEDERPDAYERYLDRLLASPAYGERWARVWLDLARYADSKGLGSDPLRTIWRYRDWVIDAYNENLSYVEFTRDQMAGDLLDDPTLEQRVATAFHRNTMTNTEGGTDDEEFRVAAVKDRVNTTGQVWMGLTVGCAQCHSHKFDPITQREYYELFAFFDQTEDRDLPDDRPLLRVPSLEGRPEYERLSAEIAGLEGELVDPDRDVAAALARWEETLAADARAWRTLRPTEVLTAEGTGSRIEADGSVLHHGASPQTETTTLVAESDVEGIAALRLEVLPHAEIPGGGPGRGPAGNFVLNDLRLEVERARAAPVRGRYLRITNTGNELLSLAEVEVFDDGVNVAPDGEARQSTTAYEGPAHLAIDGNTDGQYHASRSVTHTDHQDDPWWELDLGRDRELDRIVIWNRTDGRLEERLSSFEVELLDAAHEAVWRTAVEETPDPSLALEPATHRALVPLEHASADFAEEGWGPERAIDRSKGRGSGWAIAPRGGEAHAAVFRTRWPVGAPGGARLRLTLAQVNGGGLVLGRFRVSVTDRPDALEPPAEVAAVLAKPPAERAPDELERLRAYFATQDPELAAIRERIAALEIERKAIASVTVPVMSELAPDSRRTTRVLQKGNFLRPGDAVEARVPAELHAWPGGAPRNRLGLAAWLTDDDNPLTARVAVNRLWARLFGRGLVESEEDFGTQGTPPSHAELLDWLAVEFVEGGWDQKAFLKELCTSATYRQSSRATPDRLERDPKNRLFSRGARFRLEAEMVRDQALAVSGLLSRKMYGPSVFPPQPEGLWQAAFNGADRKWNTSRGEDRYRRGLYTFLRRTSPYPSMTTFDAPTRETCTSRRFRTNTPLQAFVTLNDPAYVEAAQALARRIVREGGETAEERARFGLELALVRPADEPGRSPSSSSSRAPSSRATRRTRPRRRGSRPSRSGRCQRARTPRSSRRGPWSRTSCSTWTRS